MLDEVLCFNVYHRSEFSSHSITARFISKPCEAVFLNVSKHQTVYSLKRSIIEIPRFT